ncbi:MAG: phage portal protein [Clostridia bacterium]|nr:phage portal protein [Clostridia bacterium]
MAERKKSRTIIPMRFTERLTSVFQPEKGMRMYLDRVDGEKRERKRELLEAAKTASASGYYYNGASKTKNSLIGWITGGGSAEDDIDLQGSTLRIRSRDLYTAGGLGRGAPETMVTNVVGWGIRPKPKIDADLLGMSEEAATEWQRIALREFNLWAKTSMCDASRQNTFWEMQELAFRSMLMSGDVFALFGQKPNLRNPYQLVIRLLEADRICTPESTGGSEMKNTDSGGRIVDGVELNKEGEVIKYHIATYHPLADETPEEITWQDIEAFGEDTGMPNILHIMTVERPEQHRGIPFISAMIVQIKQLDRYLDAELAASLVAAMLTVFIMNDGTDDDGYDSINDGIQDEDKVTNDSMKIELGNGNIYEMPPGKHIEKVGENRAPTAFDSFVQQVITMIGSSRGIPYEVLMHRYDSNYTASRSAMLDFWKEVRRYRQHFTQRFNQPIYEQWLAEAVALGRIDAPGFFDDPAVRDAWCGCQWIGTSQGHVQPVQEANAAKIRMETGISTGEQEAMEYNGSDWMENIAQRKRELKAMADVTTEERTDENAQ